VALVKAAGPPGGPPAPGSPPLVSNQTAVMEGRPGARDPYREDYLDFPALYFKVLLRSRHLLSSFKLHLLGQWASRHPERKEDIFILISALPFKDYKAGEVVGVARSWGLGCDAVEEVTAMATRAQEEKDRELEERKEQDKAHKRLRRERHFMHPGMMMDFPMFPPGLGEPVDMEDMPDHMVLHF